MATAPPLSPVDEAPCAEPERDAEAPPEGAAPLEGAEVPVAAGAPTDGVTVAAAANKSVEAYVWQLDEGGMVGV